MPKGIAQKTPNVRYTFLITESLINKSLLPFTFRIFVLYAFRGYIMLAAHSIWKYGTAGSHFSVRRKRNKGSAITARITTVGAVQKSTCCISFLYADLSFASSS